jgi:hypothetical protein
VLSKQRAISIIIVAIAFAIFTQFLLPRPQIATYLLFAIYLRQLLLYRLYGEAKRLYWLAPLMLVWVNMHGGYLVGITLIIIFILSEAADRLLQISPERGTKPALRPLMFVLALCLGASLLNPYGYHQWLYPFQVMAMSASNVITEWASPNFHEILNQLYLVLILGFFFARTYSYRRPALAEVVTPFFFILMSLISIRHVPIALLVLIPALAQALSDFAIPQRLRDSKLIAWLAARRRTLQSGPQLGKVEYILNWMVLAILIATASVIHSATLNRLQLHDNTSLPVQAVDFIEKTGISGNILNEYAFGGYLLYRLYPHSRVFIDGRADLYGDQFIDDYRTIYYTRAGWRDLLSRYSVDMALFNNKAPIVMRLQQEKDFRLVYRDEHFSLLIRNCPAYRKVIEQYQVPSVL